MTQMSFRGDTGQWWRRDISVLFSAKTYLRLHFLVGDHDDICFTFFDHTINFVSKTNDFLNLFFSLSEELICIVHFLPHTLC